MFTQNIKIAFRNLKKKKGQTFICMIALAVGISCFTTANYLIRLIYSYNEKFPHYERMINIEAVNKQEEKRITFPLKEIQSLYTIPGIKAIGIYQYNYDEKLVYDFQFPDGTEKPYQSLFCKINEDFLEVYSIEVVTGSLKDIFIRPGALLITESMANKVYGNESPIGRRVSQGEQVYTIQAVIKDMPTPNKVSFFHHIELFGGISAEEDYPFLRSQLLMENKHSLPVIRQFIEDKDLKFNLEHWDVVNHPEHDKEYKIKVISMSEEKKEIYKAPDVIFIIGIGFILLMIGITNFLSLHISSFYNRLKEISLRQVLGIGKKRLFSLLFTELTFIILIAGCLSISFMELFFPFCLRLLNELFGNNFYVDSGLLLVHQIQYILYIWLGCRIVVWITILKLLKLPAMQGMRGGTQTGKKQIVRNTLLGFQLFISLLFIGISFIFYKQAGVLSESLYPTFPVEEQKDTYYVSLNFKELEGVEREIIRELREHPYITGYVETGSVHFPYFNESEYVTPSGNKEKIYVIEAGPDFPDFIHLPLIMGKEMDEPGSIIINETFYNYLNEQGNTQNIYLDGITYFVSAVMAESVFTHEKIDQLFLIVKPVDIPKGCYIKAAPGHRTEVREHIEKVMRNRVPTSLPLEVKSMQKIIYEDIMQIHSMTRIFAVLAFICLTICMLSVYSAITLDTQSRQKEVAIRKINGASFQDITMLFGKLYIKLLLITILLAFPLLWLFAYSLLLNLSIRYNFNNPFFWITLILFMAFIITLFIGYRLYVISRINPSEIIKTE